MNKYEEMMFEQILIQLESEDYWCPFCHANRLQRVWDSKHFGVGMTTKLGRPNGCHRCPFVRFMPPDGGFCRWVGPTAWAKYANFFDGSVWDDKVPEV